LGRVVGLTVIAGGRFVSAKVVDVASVALAMTV